MANALGYAVQLGNEKVLANLLKHMKNNLEEKTSEQDGLDIVENAEKSPYVGYTPLMLAVKSDRFECAKLLIEAKANTSVKDQQGHNLLHIAAKESSNKVLSYLIEHADLDPSEASKKGQTALDLCADNKEGAKIISEWQANKDSQAQSNMDELLKLERKKQKNAEKKKRNKQKKQ